MRSGGPEQLRCTSVERPRAGGAGSRHATGIAAIAAIAAITSVNAWIGRREVDGAPLTRPAYVRVPGT